MNTEPDMNDMNEMNEDVGRFFGQIPEELAELAMAELEELGATSIVKGYRGIYFSADKGSLYGIVYRTRLLSRVLAPLAKFRVHTPESLYRAARKVEWMRYFRPGDTFAIFSNVGNSRIRHSQYAALTLKDAIVDTFRDAGRERPNVDRDSPNVWFNLFIHENMATVNIDLGGPLHRRGYRIESVETPIRETLAAAFVRQSGWDGETPLHDPMCGSGTILHEALMHVCRIPASYLRKEFGFMRTPDFDLGLWQRIREEADRAIRPLPENLILGSDSDRNAIRIAMKNGASLPYSDRIRYRHCRFEDHPPIPNAMIITNPPYGIRQKTDGDPGILAGRFGDFLKQRCPNSTAYVYFGDRELLKHIGLRAKSRTPYENGGLDGRLARFDIYSEAAE